MLTLLFGEVCHYDNIYSYILLNKFIVNYKYYNIYNIYKYMKRKLFNPSEKRKYISIGLDKRAALAIQNHFKLTNYQMFILIWIKGIWTGILFSLVLHYFISH